MAQDLSPAAELKLLSYSSLDFFDVKTASFQKQSLLSLFAFFSFHIAIYFCIVGSPVTLSACQIYMGSHHFVMTAEFIVSHVLSTLLVPCQCKFFSIPLVLKLQNVSPVSDAEVQMYRLKVPTY